MCWILLAGIRNSLTCQTKPWADATILADSLIVDYARFYGIPVPTPLYFWLICSWNTYSS